MKINALSRVFGGAWLLLLLSLTAVWVANQAVSAAPVPAAVVMTKPGPGGHYGGSGKVAFSSGGEVFASFGPELVHLDVSVPSTPTRGSYITLPALVEDAVGQNGYVIVADSNLRVIDWRDVDYPYTIATVNTPGTAVGVAVDQDLVAVSEANSTVPFGRVRLYNIENPSNPVIEASYDLVTAARGLAFDGNYLYIANEGSGLKIMDVSDPEAPQVVGSLPTSGWAFDVVVDSGYAFVATSSCSQGCAGNLQIINVTNPTAPTSVATQPLPIQPQRLTLDGNLAYVANGNGGLIVYDVETPSTPALVSSVVLGEMATDVAVEGGFAFVVTANGLKAVDIFQPTPVIGSYRTIPSVLSVAAANDYAYVGGTSAVHVLDLSTRSAPQYLGSAAMPDLVYGLTRSGNHLYAAANTLGGLKIVDVTNPAAPVVTGTLNTPGEAHDVLVDGSLAYVADGSAGLLIVDVTNPANPIAKGTVDTSGNAWGVVVAGGYAYVADWDRGLRIINVQNPDAPFEVGFYNTPGEARRVALSGNYAFVADGDWGLRVINIQTPSNPIEVANMSTPGSAMDIEIAGTTAYLADDTRGLIVVDITNPLQPSLAAQYNSAGQSWSLAAADVEHVYMADRAGGFLVMRNDFRITGRVAVANGQPVSGVSIDLNSGDSRLTNPEGNYRFGFMSTGGFQVVPTFGSFVFSPALANVTLGPNSASNVDFVMLAAPVTTTVSPSTTTQLTYLDTQGLPTTLDFPAGAVTMTVKVTLTPTYQPDLGDLDFAGHAFDLTVVDGSDNPLPGFVFALPLTLTVQYSALDHAGMSESDLVMLWQVLADWLPAETSCEPAGTPTLNTIGNQLVIPICTAGSYGLFGPSTGVYLPFVQRP